MNNIIYRDLQYILKNTKNIFPDFINKKIFITGGTGFIGKWLLEVFSFANRELSSNIRLFILSRNPESFISSNPELCKNHYFTFIKGDITDFSFFEPNIDIIIHAATDASAKLNHEKPLVMIDSIIKGTRNVLEFAKNQKIKRMLYISSGAVYGIQPNNIDCFSEDFLGGPNQLDPSSAYAEAKRTAELLCACYSEQFQIEISIARCFAFVGPFLPLDKHFAIGNFILNGLKGEDITIKGDGLPLRSYMYSADLIIWLLYILAYGANRNSYNVGSDISISIMELAQSVLSFFPGLKINLLKQTSPTDRNQNYVPCTKKIKYELSVPEILSLNEAISQTILYHRLNEKI